MSELGGIAGLGMWMKSCQRHWCATAEVLRSRRLNLHPVLASRWWPGSVGPVVFGTGSIAYESYI